MGLASVDDAVAIIKIKNRKANALPLIVERGILFLCMV
jgi:hypothetical protein